MGPVARRCIALAALCVIMATGAAASELFDFKPLQTYASVPIDEDLYEFRAVLKSDSPGGDAWLVEYDTYVPDGWFSQFCQTSTGTCYFDDAVIDVRNDDPDTLRIDFFLTPGEPGVGWADIRVSRLDDPLDYAQATFTVGLGVSLPTPSFNFIHIGAAAKQGAPGELIDFFAQLKSNNNYADEIIITPTMQIPGDWFAQYCQTSTGTCYFERATLPLGAFVVDSLRVDFFTGSMPDVGNMQLRVQAASNPSIWKSLPFHVQTGSVPASVDGGTGAFTGVSVAPNPVSSRGLLEFALSSQSPVRMLLFDSQGRVVTDCAIGMMAAGRHQWRWDALDASGTTLPSGTYFYRLDSGNGSAAGKIVIAR